MWTSRAQSDDLTGTPPPVVQQCGLIALAPSTFYYRPEPVSEQDLKIMLRMDQLHLEMPFAGARMLRDKLRLEGYHIGRKHAATLMRRMGLEALYRKPNLGKRHPKDLPVLAARREYRAR